MYSTEDPGDFKLPRHVGMASGAFAYALAGVVLVTLRFVGVTIAQFAIPTGLVIALLVPALLAMLVLVFQRASRRADREWNSRGHIDPGARVLVHTARWDPGTLERELEATRHGFDPEIAHVPLAAGFDRAGIRLAWLGGIAGLLAGLGIEFILPWGPEFASAIFWSIGGLTILGAVVLPEFVFPTYLRILPGRLDVVRGALIGERVWIVHSYDLRKRRLKIANNAVLFVPDAAPPKGEPLRVEVAVSLAITHRRRALELAILKAATTAAPTPDVPHDRLLG